MREGRLGLSTGQHDRIKIMRSKLGTKVRRAKPLKGGPRARAAANDPLYLRVARALKKEIVGGVYPVGSQLPTEDDLCERFSVSRYTVREALRRLREDNLVSSRQGAGTIVVPRCSSDSYVQDVMSINDLLVFAAGARFSIEATEIVIIDDKLASRTGLASGEEWLAVRGFRQTEGAEIPVCWTEYYINRDFAAVGRLLQRHTGPIFPLIEDLFGQSIVEVHQEIAAVLISPALAHGLKVEAGTAALEVRRTYKISDGGVAQVTINTHPASRFRHSMTLRRVRG
jgi:GntR family transcriptional regulator